jgi:hypothetical protein
MLLSPSHERAHAVAYMDWREAADLVAARWRTFASAEGAARRFTFASYVAALDDEEATAAHLASFSAALAA